MTVETCPTFAMRGEEIVEVYYTDWRSDDGQTWNIVGELRGNSTGVDRIVVELPVGCHEWVIPYVGGEGATFLLREDGGGVMGRACQRSTLSAMIGEYVNA